MPGRAELAAGTLLGLVLAISATAAPALATEPLPDADFLDFLGLLVEDGGEYVDPLDMAGLTFPDTDRPAVDEPGFDAPLENDDEHAE